MAGPILVEAIGFVCTCTRPDFALTSKMMMGVDILLFCRRCGQWWRHEVKGPDADYNCCGTDCGTTAPHPHGHCQLGGRAVPGTAFVLDVRDRPPAGYARDLCDHGGWGLADSSAVVESLVDGGLRAGPGGGDVATASPRRGGGKERAVAGGPRPVCPDAWTARPARLRRTFYAIRFRRCSSGMLASSRVSPELSAGRASSVRRSIVGMRSDCVSTTSVAPRTSGATTTSARWARCWRTPSAKPVRRRWSGNCAMAPEPQSTRSGPACLPRAPWPVAQDVVRDRTGSRRSLFLTVSPLVRTRWNGLRDPEVGLAFSERTVPSAEAYSAVSPRREACTTINCRKRQIINNFVRRTALWRRSRSSLLAMRLPRGSPGMIGRGLLRRLGPGVYSTNLDDPAEDVCRRNWLPITAKFCPGVVIADRSARTGQPGPDGDLFVVAKRVRAVRLPGLTIHPRPGPGPEDDDMAYPNGLWMSSRPRVLLENQRKSRSVKGGPRRTLSEPELADWVDSPSSQSQRREDRRVSGTGFGPSPGSSAWRRRGAEPSA